MAQPVRFERAGLPAGLHAPRCRGRCAVSYRYPGDLPHPTGGPPSSACPLRVRRAHLTQRAAPPAWAPRICRTTDSMTRP